MAGDDNDYDDGSESSTMTDSDILEDFLDDDSCWSPFAPADDDPEQDPSPPPCRTRQSPSLAGAAARANDDEHARIRLDWLYEKADEARQKGRPWHDVASRFNRIGNLFFRRGRCDEALAAYMQALRSSDEASRRFPDMGSSDCHDSTDTLPLMMAARAATLNNIGAVNYVRGDARAAYEAFREAHKWSAARGEFSGDGFGGGAAGAGGGGFGAVNVVATIDTLRRMHFQRGELRHASELCRWMRSFETCPGERLGI